VREIKCGKDEFVLYRLNDSAVLPYGKTDILKKRFRMGLFVSLLCYFVGKTTREF